MTLRRCAVVMLAAALVSCDALLDPGLREGGYAQVAVGMRHTCGLTAQGSAYCWGSGEQGQLGSGGTASASMPQPVQATVRFTSITAGGAHTCALADGGVLYCWGANERAQSGSATGEVKLVPEAVPVDLRFLQVSAGAVHTCARSTTGGVYCWGGNGQGQVSGGGGTDVATPRLIVAPRPLSVVSAGGFHTCALDDRSHAWCWGANHLGQLGTGDARDSAVPREVSGGRAFISISAGYLHTCAVDSGANAFCWGSAEHGELGTGGLAVPGLPGAMVPVPVHNGDSVGAVVAGYYSSCALRLNLAPICWGRGSSAQLGNGFAGDAWTPRSVLDGDPQGTLRLLEIGAGATHGCGLTHPHAIYCWGDGAYGQLGAGELRYSPIAIRVTAPR